MLKGLVINTKEEVNQIDPKLVYLNLYIKEYEGYELPLVIVYDEVRNSIKHNDKYYDKDCFGDIYTEDFFGTEEYKSISIDQMREFITQSIR